MGDIPVLAFLMRIIFNISSQINNLLRKLIAIDILVV